jgi:uncharacterized UPF0160 family protein
MALTIATHSGPFHADDVMATALLRVFVDADATVVRTRDPARMEPADVVIDVGGRFDPEARRFDHHQASYTGDRSSAGMVLDWLAETEQIDAPLAETLRTGLMDYLDAVDNGRTAPQAEVPCFPRLVDALNQTADTQEAFDEAFERAATVARWFLEGLVAGQRKIERAEQVVRQAMEDAEQAGRNVLYLDAYHSWKKPYFDHGGATHPTEFVLFPGTDGSWRVVAIPPEYGDFAQKRSFPESWAGLTGEALEAATGVAGSVFCHKNRFIAVFQTRDGALEAMRSHGLLMR